MYRLIREHRDLDLRTTAQRTILDFQLLGITELQVLAKFNYTQPFRKLNPEIFQSMYELIYVDRGQHTCNLDKESYLLSGGDLLMVRPGEEHSTGETYENRGSLYWLIGNMFFDSFLGGSQLYGKKIIDYILYNSNKKVLKVNNLFSILLKRIFNYFPVAYSKVQANDAMAPVHIQHMRSLLSELFFALYTTIERQPYTRDSDYQRLEKIKRYIEDNIYDYISLDYLAYHIANVSLPHLRNLFKTQVGLPLRDYINNRKIEYSKKQLASGQSVTDVAMEMDFSSSQYFATVFRKYTGLSPSAYQQQIGQK